MFWIVPGLSACDQALSHRGDSILIIRRLGQVRHFPGVVLQVEELRLNVLPVDDILNQFKLPILVGPLKGPVAEKQSIANGVVSGDRWEKTFGFHGFRDRNPGEIAQGREDVHQVGIGFRLLPFWNSRPGKDQWDTDAVFVTVLLPEETVLAEGESVVARKDQNGVLVDSLLLKSLDHPSQLVIEVRDHRVIFSKVLTDLFWTAWE